MTVDVADSSSESVPKAMLLDQTAAPKCKHCGVTQIDIQIQGIFGILVCSKCKSERPDEYSLLTKTECKEDYLLTDRMSPFICAFVD